MRHVSIVPGLRVRSVAAALPLWEALGFELAFAFANGKRVRADHLEGASFARVDAPTANPLSVFLDTQRGSPGSVVHLMLDSPRHVDEAAHHLLEIGTNLAQPPTDQPWGMRDLQVHDSDGHLLIIGSATDG